MGTKERRQREIAEREQLFLGRARELIREDGLLNLQMARLAEACDYATGTLYQHFASKEDLLMALSTQEVGLRVELFQRVANWTTGSRDRMFGIAVADMVFARRYPEHFRLAQYVFTEVVWGAASPERRQQALDAGKPIGVLIHGILDDAIKSGDLDPRGLRAFELATGPWTICTGMHGLVHAEGVLEMHEIREPYTLMLRYVHMMLNGMNWKPAFDPFDTVALHKKTQKLCDEVFHDLCCEAER